MQPHNNKEIEEKIRKFWEVEKIYRFNTSKKGKIYSIDAPPPTVSGNMHAGHAFSYSQQDFIARFRRMFSAGKGQVFYPFGTDDNGIPTEKLVERLNQVKSREMSRHEFIGLCLKTLKKITPEFVQQWKNIGISADFDLSYSTIDKNSQRISQKSFIELFKAGRIYTKEFPTIWCPECQTGIAQAELEDKQTETYFSTIRFEADGKYLEIATTRPELIGSCVAVFVNPKDAKYKHLKGKTAKIPIFGQIVPIIFDDSASMEKGTGAMMICSYGDKFDVDAISRHKLKPRVVLNKNGTLNVGDYKGMKTKEARRKIAEDLAELGLLVEQKRIAHTVNVHDKCGTEIEFLPTEQWFVKILDKKKELIAQGKKIKWHPEHMKKRYENWINGLGWDWIVSRDRHFGVPIPVWKCKICGEIILPEEKELPVEPMLVKKTCKKCGAEAQPEEKVMDTWATSSLSPQIASSLVGNKVKIPFSLRPQAHDIIRTWAFYTIAKSLFHEKKLPWNDIMISGFVTLGGEKLSKTKGIVIDPKVILEKYSADALRYFSAGTTLGQDMEYQEQDLVAGEKLVKKLLNASNFVFMNLKGYKPKKPKKMEKIDELFFTKLGRVVEKATSSFEIYEYSKAKQEVEQFFWKDFCDNYLEIVKWRVYNGSKQEKESAFYTLYTSLLSITKMFAPIIPFVTEHVYQEHFRKTEKEKSIHISRWPKNVTKQKKLDGLHKFGQFITVLENVRKWKSTHQKPMNSEIVLTLIKDDFKLGENLLKDLRRVTNTKELKEGLQFRVDFI